MARRNSESGGRRSARSGSGAKKSGGKPFKKSDRSEERPRRNASSPKPSYRKKEDGPERKSSKSDSRSFKGPEKPFKRSSPRGEESFEKRKSARDPERPFKKRGESSGRSTGSPSDRPKKFDKPFKKSFGRDNEDPGEKREKSAEEKKSSASYGLPYKRSYNKQALKKGSGSPRDEKAETSPNTRPEKPSGKNFKSKREIAADTQKDPDIIRLNRYIANSGLCSRREADEYITMGLVTVNGEVVSELGHKVKRSDEVRFEGKLLKAEKPVYILMNKPKGYITTTKDPQERNTVMHILGDAVKERVYPVGRLDRNTTGLLLLTNDGELADKLMHPSYMAKKIYRVELNRPLTQADFEKIQKGVYLEEGRAAVDDIAMLEDNQSVGIEIHIGWNRVVRRIFEALGYEVMKLDRTVYAGLDKKDLGRGEWRYLKQEEVIRLKHYDK
jgi:23S rRNA pseudouridine2605 synthase